MHPSLLLICHGGVSGSEPVWPWLPPDLTRARLQGVPGWALNQPRTSEYEGGTANPPWAASLGKGRSQDDKCAPGDGYPGLFCELLIACQCWSPSRARGGSSSCLVANCCVCSLVASRQSWHAKSRICWREGRPPFHLYGLGRQRFYFFVFPDKMNKNSASRDGSDKLEAPDMPQHRLPITAFVYLKIKSPTSLS